MWYVNKDYYKDVINNLLWICPKTLKWWWYDNDIKQFEKDQSWIYDDQQRPKQMGGPPNAFIGASHFIENQNKRIVTRTTDLLYRINKYVEPVGSEVLSKGYVEKRKVFKPETEQGRQGWKIDINLLRSNYDNIKNISTDLTCKSQAAVNTLRRFIVGIGVGIGILTTVLKLFGIF